MHSCTSRLYINSLLSLLSIFFLLFDVDFELGLDKLLINFDFFFFPFAFRDWSELLRKAADAVIMNLMEADHE